MSEPTKKSYFSPPETIEEAEKQIVDASNGFLALAALQGTIGFFVY